MYNMVTELKPNEVFVFGSNSTGFHGAGSAGLACRGDSRNTWRTDSWFLNAMRSPVGSSDRIGKWAVYGVSRGLQTGRCGMSYGIQTIEHPGYKRSTSLNRIQAQLLELSAISAIHSELKFLMTPVGTGLAGWKSEEMKIVWCDVVEKMPNNVVYPPDLYDDVKIQNT